MENGGKGRQSFFEREHVQTMKEVSVCPGSTDSPQTTKMQRAGCRRLAGAWVGNSTERHHRHQTCWAHKGRWLVERALRRFWTNSLGLSLNLRRHSCCTPSCTWTSSPPLPRLFMLTFVLLMSKKPPIFTSIRCYTTQVEPQVVLCLTNMNMG